MVERRKSPLSQNRQRRLAKAVLESVHLAEHFESTEAGEKKSGKLTESMKKCPCPSPVPFRLIVPDHSLPTLHLRGSGQELSPIHG